MRIISGLSILAIGVAALALPTSHATAQQKTYTLKIASFTPKPASSSRWFEAKKKEVAAQTGGRLKIEMFYGSSMGPMPRHYDLARKGVADASFFQHGVTRGRFPLTELTHSPYMFPLGAKGSQVATMVAMDLMPSHLAAEHKGTKPIWIVFNRPSGLFDSKKKIRTIADLKGRRYRAPTPFVVSMLKELGAVPIGMPATHMAENLQKGTIDGVVTDPMGIFAFKMGTLVKTYTPRMFIAMISFGLAMNVKTYDKLPGDLKKIVDGWSTKAAAVDMAKLAWNDFPVFTKYYDGSNIGEVAIDPAADARMRVVADKIVADRIAVLEKKGLPARAVHAKMKALSAKYSAM